METGTALEPCCEGASEHSCRRHAKAFTSTCREMAVWTDKETTKLIELWGEDIQVRGWGMKLKAIEAATASMSTTLLRECWCLSLSRASLHCLSIVGGIGGKQMMP